MMYLSDTAVRTGGALDLIARQETRAGNRTVKRIAGWARRWGSSSHDEQVRILHKIVGELKPTSNATVKRMVRIAKAALAGTSLQGALKA